MLTISFEILICLGIINWVDGSYMSPMQQSSNHTLTNSTTTLNNTFVCRAKPTTFVTQFELNVTLSSPAVLTLVTPSGELFSSASDNKWHFVVDRNYNFNTNYGYVDVKFYLTYQNATLDGNCSFEFPQGLSTQTSSTRVIASSQFQPQEQVSLDVTPSTSSSSELNPSFVTNTDYIPYISTTTATASLQFTETGTFPFTESTSTVVTDPPHENTSQNSMCRCPCECVSPMPQFKADEMLTEIIESLQITKSVTSSSKRKLISAPDDRVSSQSIGFVGAFVISVVFGIIIIGDVHLLFSNFKTALTRLKGKLVTCENCRPCRKSLTENMP